MEGNTMSTEENKAVIRHFNKMMNKGDTSVIDEVLTSKFVMHLMGSGRDLDKATYKKNNSNRRTSYTDVSLTIDDIIAEADKVSVRATWRGTQKEQFGNIAPTGKSVSATRFTIFRLEDGKIAEAWTLHDELGIFQQLGAIPSTEEIGK